MIGGFVSYDITWYVTNQLVVQNVPNIALSENLWYLPLGKGLERWYTSLGALASLMWEFCCKAEMEVLCFRIIQQEAELGSYHILVNC